MKPALEVHGVFLASEIQAGEMEVFSICEKDRLTRIVETIPTTLPTTLFLLEVSQSQQFHVVSSRFLKFHQQLHQKILQSCQPAVFSHDPKDHGGYIHRNLTNGHLFVISSSAASRMKRFFLQKDPRQKTYNEKQPLIKMYLLLKKKCDFPCSC